MRTLFDDDIAVAYHSFGIEVSCDENDDDSEDSSELVGYNGGQINGLCGAAVPGVLQFITGLHTGDVRVRIELHGTEPPIDLVWPEIVEASFSPSTPGIHIVIWGGTRRFHSRISRYVTTGCDSPRPASTTRTTRLAIRRSVT